LELRNSGKNEWDEEFQTGFRKAPGEPRAGNWNHGLNGFNGWDFKWSISP
jgi:hypothetical protein